MSILLENPNECDISKQVNSKIKTVSVVIPAHYEQEAIGPVLSGLQSAIRQMPDRTVEVVVVVDQREDPTVAVAESYGAKVLINDCGRGKGNALYFGLRHAKGDAIVIMDSDGSHDPEDLGRFVEALDQGAGLVIGSRVLGGSDDHNVIRLFGNALFTVMVTMAFGTTLMDTLNGYKAFMRDVVSGYRPRASGFEVEIEIVARAVRKGHRIVEISAHEYRRAGGKMKSRAIRDGFRILWACLREGFVYRLSRLFTRQPTVQASQA